MNFFYWILIIIIFLGGIALIVISSIYLNEKKSSNKFANLVMSLKSRKSENKTDLKFEDKNGIVIVAGGPVYGPLGLRLVNRLEELGSKLDIEIWALDELEMNEPSMKTLALKPNIIIRNLKPFYENKKIPKLKRQLGFICKSIALYNSKFKNVLLLDADNLVLQNPDNLFDLLKTHNAVLWPDTCKFDQIDHFKLLGITFPKSYDSIKFLKYEQLFKNLKLKNTKQRQQYESGQLLFNRTKCIDALKFIVDLNLNYDSTYKIFNGDKDTYAIALEISNIDFFTVPYNMALLGTNEHEFKGKAFVQRHPITGKPLFVHFAGPASKKITLNDCTHIMYPTDNATVISYPDRYRRWSEGSIEKFDLE